MQNSTAQLAPLIDLNGNYVWYGGYNVLYMDNTNSTKAYVNAYFERGSSLFVNNGFNCFNITDIPIYNHITGYLPDQCQYQLNASYFAEQNFWNLTSPRLVVYCGGNPVVTYTAPIANTCQTPSQLSPINMILTDKDDGLIDTVLITTGPGQNIGGGHASNTKIISGGQDRSLYEQIVQNGKQKDYSSAIIKAKLLINNYDTSSYFLSTLDQLYLCYEQTDTTNNQNTTNALYGGLKSYLSQKMTDYENHQSFVEKSYDYYLMCLVKQRLFTEAITGYENIMENHPDPLRRLTASWDRAAVVLLMNGGGGGESVTKYKMNWLMNKNPHKLVKNMYKAQSKSITENQSDVNNKSKYTKEEKQELGSRTIKFNPSTNKEFRDKVAGDKKLIMKVQKIAAQSKDVPIDNLPKVYKLYQNYPNPFNPETTIKYDLPKDGIV